MTGGPGPGHGGLPCHAGDIFLARRNPWFLLGTPEGPASSVATSSFVLCSVYPVQMSSRGRMMA